MTSSGAPRWYNVTRLPVGCPSELTHAGRGGANGGWLTILLLFGFGSGDGCRVPTAALLEAVAVEPFLGLGVRLGVSAIATLLLTPFGVAPLGEFPLGPRDESRLVLRPLGEGCRLDEPDREGLRPRDPSFPGANSGLTWGDSQSFPFLQVPFTKKWASGLVLQRAVGLGAHAKPGKVATAQEVTLVLNRP